MWKPEHRAAADRRGLRYESDLTDAEWALVAPLIRPGKRGGRPRTVNVREMLNAIFYVLWTAVSGRPCPGTCRRAARSGSTSTYGSGMEHWSASTTRSMRKSGKKRAAKQARRRRSSIVRPRREPGGFARSVGVRCRQEGGRPQA